MIFLPPFRMEPPRLARARFRAAWRGVAAIGFWLLSGAGMMAGQPALPVLPAWPPPPAEPYIVYVREYSCPRDIGARPAALVRFANWITGVGADEKKLARPFGLSLDDRGNLLVTDTGANAVCYLDFARKKWLRWTAAGKTPFQSPVAAAHHGATFFVADSALGKVMAFDESGQVRFEITNGLARPSGLAVLGDRLLIADAQLHQIVICGMQGQLISKFGRRGNGPGEFNFPTHINADARGQIYVTDSLNHRIQIFDASGKFLREFGRAGDGPGRFSRPKGAAADSAGHVYVVDALFDNVQIFDEQGRLLLDWGGTGSAAGQFSLPNAIAINSRNEIFVADTYNHRIQMFRYTGKQ
ncbi:MAG: 6-bladed beta-propeller [Verrucomicrobiota bacterium]